MRHLWIYQVLLLVAVFVAWHVLTATGILPPFFFGRPLLVLEKTWEWFASGKIYAHLWITLVETVLAFLGGTVLGLGVGLWLALSPTASALLDPYIKAANSMPRVILAPIFAVWFGSASGRKWRLALPRIFIVFFNVYQGVKEVSPVVLANAACSARARAISSHRVLPSATSWVFSSLHTAVGRLSGSGRGRVPGFRGGGLSHPAGGIGVDINHVFAGILVLTAFALALDGLVTERRSAARVAAAQGETEPR